MKIMIVLDNENRLLFEGTKQDCIHFVKRNQIQRGTYTMQELTDVPKYEAVPPPTITASPQKPKGIFKRIFHK